MLDEAPLLSCIAIDTASLAALIKESAEINEQELLSPFFHSSVRMCTSQFENPARLSPFWPHSWPSSLHWQDNFFLLIFVLFPLFTGLAQDGMLKLEKRGRGKGVVGYGKGKGKILPHLWWKLASIATSLMHHQVQQYNHMQLCGWQGVIVEEDDNNKIVLMKEISCTRTEELWSHLIVIFLFLIIVIFAFCVSLTLPFLVERLEFDYLASWDFY